MTKSATAILFCMLATTSAVAAVPEPVPAPLEPIASLDLPRYLGRWYEIAKYPNRFQQQCARNTQAEYVARPDGRAQVTNRCTAQDGSRAEAIGVARQVGDARSPRLKVRFAPAWLSFIPAVWGNYWVIDLDEQYQLAAVSEPRREFLWILSRSPTVSPERYAALLERLAAQGFDLQKLETTPQDTD